MGTVTGTYPAQADATRAWVAVRVVAIAAIAVVTALTTEAADWEPVTLVLALTVVYVVADVGSVAARRIRFSAGLMVQTTMMALLGAGPAVVASSVSTAVESRINRVTWPAVLNNIAVFALLGLVGGALFEAIRSSLDLERHDTTYALLVLPVYVLLSALNLFLIVADHPNVAVGTRLRVLRETVLPALPLELITAALAAVAVLVWAQAGLAAAAALLLVLTITIPLARTLADALVSDERAAEVARLSSDRERLLSEVLQAEERERARLAETLHDGPMQRLMAIRQDFAESTQPTDQIDAAIAETRAIISAFHPPTVREIGFEASLRAAVAPFPAARTARLTVETLVDDRVLAGSLLLPIAQELVVNAVKHADPSTIDVRVGEDGETLVLEVNDDGIGIDTGEAGRAVQAGHVGLAMVRRRVEDAGGALEIATRPDGGTRSRVLLPAATAFS